MSAPHGVTDNRCNWCGQKTDAEKECAALREALQAFCIAANIRTGLADDELVYRVIENEFGGAMASAWMKARLLIAKGGKQ